MTGTCDNSGAQRPASAHDTQWINPVRKRAEVVKLVVEVAGRRNQ